ncbi:Circadian clock-controlled protein [Camponotus floridanus]|uniref:Circadian clock-controlled protein n=1 Tax=Camponotus floridanus TaxID=104421 RepID=E1ZV42_CAMFO|nr:Circadian clock-controlled protein [Camponotus floridanus]
MVSRFFPYEARIEKRVVQSSSLYMKEWTNDRQVARGNQLNAKAQLTESHDWETYSLVFGPSTFKIRDFKIDPNNVVLTFKVGFQKLDFRGKYQINAQILLLRLVGEGNVTGNFLGYESDCFLKSHKVIRNNQTHIIFEKMKFNIKINKAHINLDNLFNGDPVLGPASNEVLNANSDLLVDEIKPVLEDALSDLFTNISNKITEAFTYDELFPDN